MKGKILEIINHYGINHQQRKLEEEVFELQEAIIEFECDECKYYDKVIEEYTKHIAEEIADCMVLLKQFQAYYNISSETIKEIMISKIERQLERIKNE